jgi:hypothetical protein
VVELTVAVLEMVPVAAGLTAYVLVIVRTCPAVIVPRLHGNGVAQAPLFETNVVCAGVGSATVTFAASEGPLFVTVIVYVAFCPATSALLSAFVIVRSALVETAFVAVELSLPGIGSVVDELTDAVFEIVPVALEATENIELIVTLDPAASVANVQGKFVAQAPLFETNVNPAPGVSVTDTDTASDGPLLVTRIPYVTF